MDGPERERMELEARIEALEAKVGPLERAVAKLLEDRIEAEWVSREVAAASAVDAEPIEAPEPAAPAPTRRPSWFEEALAADRRIAAAEAARAQAEAGVLTEAGTWTEVSPTAAGGTASGPTEAAEPGPAWAAPAGSSSSDFRLPQVSTPGLDLQATLADLEERMAGRALVFVGGVALVLGAILFLGLAFSQGWIGEEARVALGLLAGSMGLGLGAWFMERGNRLLGHVVTPVGLAVITISLVAATQLYHLVPVPIGLALALFAAIVTAVIAVRADSQLVAGFGLVAVLVAPPLLGATPDLTTLAFVGAALVGTTAIALWRTWPWLPPLAFVLAAPQAASWLLGETNVAFGLVGLAAFTALQAVAAGGEEFRRRRDDLSPSSATLLLASATFLVWGGFVLLDGDLAAHRMTFLIVAALAYLGLGGYFIVRDGDRHLFGLLAAGTGLAALTMAFPIGLGAPAVPVAWTAEAAVLAWVAVRRPHPYSALVSGLLYALAAGWLLLFVFPWAGPPAQGVPFANADGAALATYLVGVAVGIWLVPILAPRRALAALGIGLAAWSAGLELSGPVVVAVEMGLAVLAAALLDGLARLPERSIDWRPTGPIALVWPELPDLGSLARPALVLVALLAGAAATVHLLVVDTARLGGTAAAISSEIPFVSDAGVALAAYLVGLGAIGWLRPSPSLRQRLMALGLLVTAAVCPVELDDVVLVAAWSALAVLGLAAWGWLRSPATPEPVETADAQEEPASEEPVAVLGGAFVPFRPRHPLLSALPVSVLLVGALAVGRSLLEMPPRELVYGSLPPVPFVDMAAAMAAVLAVASVVGGLVVGGPTARRVGVLGAGLVVAYAIPFQVAPWAVVVLWSALASAAFLAVRSDPGGRDWYLGAGGTLLSVTLAVGLLIVAPATRLTLPGAIDPLVALQSLVALASIVVACGVAIAQSRGDPLVRWAEAAVGGLVVYALSVAIVDAFATQVGGPIAIEELRWQSQVALSVAWALLGMGAFVAGLRSGRSDLRIGGLVLLAITTAKVFVIDLASLDTAYKVMALIGLGLILLISGGLWQRMRTQPPTEHKGGQHVHP